MTAPTRFRFGEFIVSETDLIRHGRPVIIDPLPLRVLIYLMTRRPEPVTREELRTHVWGSDVYLDDSTISKAVSRLKAALGDSRRYPRFIRRVSRKGYAFIGKAEPITAWTSDEPPAAVRTERVPLHPGDKSRFVRDINLPDGSLVAVNQRIVKVWEIQNVGTVPWRNRFLQRVGPADVPGRLKSADRTPISDTDPGQRCQIEVEVITPATPGSSRADWKMVDAEGALLLPNQSSLFVSIEVRYPHDL